MDFRRLLFRPAIAVLLLAPFLGECLSGSTPPLDLILPWNLALMMGLYGCGALICREVKRRFGLGLTGLILLGAAYGVYEEALVDKYWFYEKFWHDAGVNDYSEVWHTNLLLATHLTAFHAAVSICASVLIVERLFPDRQQTAWAGPRGLAVAGVTLFALVPFVYGEFNRGPGAAVLIAAGCLAVLLVVCAFLVPRWRGRSGATLPMPRAEATTKPPDSRTPRRGLGWIAFACTTAHFLLVYSLPSTGIPWPFGLLISMAPIAIGIFLVRRMVLGDEYGSDALRVITGILFFFVLLDFFVGLGGRYDMTIGAIATAFALRWLNKRARADQVPERSPGIRSADRAVS